MRRSIHFTLIDTSLQWPPLYGPRSENSAPVERFNCIAPWSGAMRKELWVEGASRFIPFPSSPTLLVFPRFTNRMQRHLRSRQNTLHEFCVMTSVDSQTLISSPQTKTGTLPYLSLQWIMCILVLWNLPTMITSLRSNVRKFCPSVAIVERFNCIAPWSGAVRKGLWVEGASRTFHPLPIKPQAARFPALYWRNATAPAVEAEYLHEFCVITSVDSQTLISSPQTKTGTLPYLWLQWIMCILVSFMNLSWRQVLM